MADITLTAAVRDSLLSLQNTTSLIDRTQGRLSSGLRVAGPVDDPVSYFQAKGLNDRAFDFTEKKSSIEQGISTVTAALDGVNAIEKLVRQMKGIVNSMKSATESQMSDLVSQFNDLRTQIDNLASDGTYQGTNLINGTGTTLNVEFSNDTASRLNVASVDITVATQGLNITEQAVFTTQAIVGQYSSADYAAATSHTAAFEAGLTAGQTINVTWEGPTTTYSSASGDLTFSYGTASLTVTARGDQALTAGTVLTITVATTTTGSGFTVLAEKNMQFAVDYSGSAADSAVSASADANLVLTYDGPTSTFTTANAGTANQITFDFNTGTITMAVLSGTSFTLSAGQEFTLQMATSGLSVATAVPTSGFFTTNGSVITLITSTTGAWDGTAALGVSLATHTGMGTMDYVKAGDSTSLGAILTELDTALTSLRTEAQKLGTNVALLQTRLDFTESYVNTLTAGAAKLTLADVNEEGANLLALQTRQQLGIQALSFAGQAEQSVLSLFR